MEIKGNFMELWTQRSEAAKLAAAVVAGAEKEKRGLSDPEIKQMADIESRIKTIDAQIEAELRSPVNLPRIPGAPVGAEERAALSKLTLRSVVEAMQFDGEKRALASGAAGVPKIIESLLEFIAESNPMRRLATVYTIAGDGSVPIPGTPTGAWGAEGAVTTPTDVAVTPAQFSAFNFNGSVTVNDATLDDLFFDAMGMLTQAIGAYLGEVEGTAMLGAGAGADRPQGLFNSGTAVQTATTATVVIADFINFINSLETKWRKGNERLILSPTVLAAIINLKDNTGKIELDQTSQVINGIPFELTSLAPAYASTTGTKLAALGNMKRAYAVAQRASDKGTFKMKIVDLSTSFQKNVLFNERVDGRVVDSAAYKVWTVK